MKNIYYSLLFLLCYAPMHNIMGMAVDNAPTDLQMRIAQIKKQFIFLILNSSFFDYMSRSADCVIFDENGNPLLSELEATLYQSGFLTIPYRNNNSFYNSISPDHVVMMLIAKVISKNKNSEVLVNFLDINADTQASLSMPNMGTAKYMITGIRFKKGVIDHGCLLITVRYDNENMVSFLIDSCGKNGLCFQYLTQYMMQKINLIDASNNDPLQCDFSDKNCALYTYNYSKAAIKLFAQENQLSDVILFCKQHKFTEAAQLLHENLKQYLPIYFGITNTNQYVVKSYDDIKKHHFKQRWQLGNRYLKNFKSQYLNNITA